jgi:ParB family chromosome partitioning protein
MIETKAARDEAVQGELSRSSEARPRLGRGLAALLADARSPDSPSSASQASLRTAPIELIRTNPNNPRRDFNETSLDELAESIKKRGIIQPVVVRALTDDHQSFEIIAGERRWRSAQRAGLHEVPIIVVEATDREALELAIIENVQRSDLNAIEEATGYAKLSSEHDYSHIEIAAIIGKSRSHVTNTLRLLKLPEFTRTLVESGKLSAGHARALLSTANPDEMARKVVSDALTVRDVENLEKRPKITDVRSPVSQSEHRDINALDLEMTLTVALGAKVRIKGLGERGEITIYYSNLEQLDEIAGRLKTGK